MKVSKTTVLNEDKEEITLMILFEDGSELQVYAPMGEDVGTIITNTSTFGRQGSVAWWYLGS